MQWILVSVIEVVFLFMLSVHVAFNTNICTGTYMYTFTLPHAVTCTNTSWCNKIAKLFKCGFMQCHTCLPQQFQVLQNIVYIHVSIVFIWSMGLLLRFPHMNNNQKFKTWHFHWNWMVNVELLIPSFLIQISHSNFRIITFIVINMYAKLA